MERKNYLIILMEIGRNSNKHYVAKEVQNIMLPCKESTNSWLSSFLESLKNIFCIKGRSEKDKLSGEQKKEKREDHNLPNSHQLPNISKPHFLNAIRFITEDRDSKSTIVKKNHLFEPKTHDNSKGRSELSLKRHISESSGKDKNIPMHVEKEPLPQRELTNRNKKRTIIDEEERQNYSAAAGLKKQIQKMQASLAVTINTFGSGLTDEKYFQKRALQEKAKSVVHIQEKQSMNRTKNQDSAIQTDIIPQNAKVIEEKKKQFKKKNYVEDDFQEDEGFVKSRAGSLAPTPVIKVDMAPQETNLLCKKVLFESNAQNKITESAIPKETPSLFGNLIQNTIKLTSEPNPITKDLSTLMPKKEETILENPKKENDIFATKPSNIFAIPETKTLKKQPSQTIDSIKEELQCDTASILPKSTNIFNQFTKTGIDLQANETPALPSLFKKASETSESKLFQSITTTTTTQTATSNPISQPSLFLQSNIPLQTPTENNNKIFPDNQSAPTKPLISSLFGLSTQNMPSPPSAPGLFSTPTVNNNVPSLFGSSSAISSTGFTSLTANNPSFSLFGQPPQIGNPEQAKSESLFQAPSQDNQMQSSIFPGLPIEPPKTELNFAHNITTQHSLFSNSASSTPSLFGSGGGLFGANVTPPAASKNELL